MSLADGSRLAGSCLRGAALLAVLVAGSACTGWHARQEAQSAYRLLQSLDAALQRQDSATAVLEQWCADRRLARPARISAVRLAGEERAPDAAVRAALRVSDTEAVRHRRVQLRCGDRVLSSADNWYVPARLDAAMNRQLETSDVPFGRVVQPLGFRRLRLDSEWLWQPAAHPGGTPPLPAELLRQRAVLLLPDGTPISYVVETYRREAVQPQSMAKQ